MCKVSLSGIPIRPYFFCVLIPREISDGKLYRDSSMYNIRKIHGSSNPMTFRPLCALPNWMIGSFNYRTQFHYKIRWEKNINVTIKKIKKKPAWEFIAFSVWYYVRRFNLVIQSPTSKQWRTIHVRQKFQFHSNGNYLLQ